MAKIKFEPKSKTLKRTVKIRAVTYGRKLFYLLQVASIIVSFYLAYRLL